MEPVPGRSASRLHPWSSGRSTGSAATCDIVTTLGERQVGMKSLTIRIEDAITPHGTLMFGMIALMTEYKAAPIRECTQAGPRCPSHRPRTSAVWRTH